MVFEVFQVPAFDDNYIFFLHSPSENKTCVIDPGAPQVVKNFLSEKNWDLTDIWITHHHFDHIGGLKALADSYPQCEIKGPKYDQHRIPGLKTLLQDGDNFDFYGTPVQIYFLPGHTLGHIAYHLPEENILFSGDVIFSLGCGRLFEGTPEQMHQSLQRISQLPENTQIYCTHEYTQANVEFALSLGDPSKKLLDFSQTVQVLRAQGHPTVPTTVAREKQLNPFVRAGSVEEFRQIREMKDQF